MMGTLDSGCTVGYIMGLSNSELQTKKGENVLHVSYIAINPTLKKNNVGLQKCLSG